MLQNAIKILALSFLISGLLTAEAQARESVWIAAPMLAESRANGVRSCGEISDEIPLVVEITNGVVQPWSALEQPAQKASGAAQLKLTAHDSESAQISAGEQRPVLYIKADAQEAESVVAEALQCLEDLITAITAKKPIQDDLDRVNRSVLAREQLKLVASGKTESSALKNLLNFSAVAGAFASFSIGADYAAAAKAVEAQWIQTIKPGMGNQVLSLSTDPNLAQIKRLASKGTRWRWASAALVVGALVYAGLTASNKKEVNSEVADLLVLSNAEYREQATSNPQLADLILKTFADVQADPL